MRKEKLLLTLGLLILLVGTLMISNRDYVFKTSSLDVESISGNSKTAHELVREIKIGYNIGNTLDSANYKKEFLGTEQGVSYYETLWHNPEITEELISFLKESGFDSLRVPVTYYDHLNADGTIDELWLKRVSEVVDLVLKYDMYCIIDIHHDSGLFEGSSWIKADANNYEKTANDLKNIWLQIATYFKDYDYRLMFEGFNEIIDSNRNYSWDYGYDNVLLVNDLNQVFVNTVRETGSKNLDRFLIVSTYAAITDEQKLKAFKMPTDIADDKIILGLHDYASTEEQIEIMLSRIENLTIAQGIPVMLDEFGTTNKMNEDTRAEIAKKYVSMAHTLNIPCYWWDNGGDYAIIDRTTLSWKYEKIKDAMMSVFIDNDKPDIPLTPEEPREDDNKEDKEEIKEPVLDETSDKEDNSINEFIASPLPNNISKEEPINPSFITQKIKEPEKEELRQIQTNNLPQKNKDEITYIPEISESIIEEVTNNEEINIYDGMSVETFSSQKLTSKNINNREENDSARIFKLGILLIILVLIIVLTFLLNKRRDYLENNK